jgi:hypothetical protein
MNRMMALAAVAALGVSSGCMTQQYSDSDALSKVKTSPDWKKFWSNEKPNCKPEPGYLPASAPVYMPATGTPVVLAPSVPKPTAPTPPPSSPSALTTPAPTPPVTRPPVAPTLPPPTAEVTIANVRGEAITMFRLQQQKLVFVAQVPAGKAVDQTIEVGTVLVATLSSAPHCVHFTVEQQGGVFLIRESYPQPSLPAVIPGAPPTVALPR